MPASRRARAMIFAPRSWPSSPGLAITTRILRAMGGSLRSERPIRPVDAPARPPAAKRQDDGHEHDQPEHASHDDEDPARAELGPRVHRGPLERAPLRLREDLLPQWSPVADEPAVVRGRADVPELDRVD